MSDEKLVKTLIANGTMRGALLESTLHSPMLGKEVHVAIYLDGPKPNERQLSLLVQFLGFGEQHLGKIKAELWGHFNNWDWVDTSVYSTPDEVFDACQLHSLNIDYPSNGTFSLSFGVPWDEEHGAVVYIEGEEFCFGNY